MPRAGSRGPDAESRNAHPSVEVGSRASSFLEEKMLLLRYSHEGKVGSISSRPKREGGGHRGRKISIRLGGHLPENKFQQLGVKS